ncbi:TasA family protein [Romboutsia sp.]|uniref:TasA family protein n=1 Tax=Romboutsia sp. TaxID=1965302 RepID=UPI003F34870F
MRNMKNQKVKSTISGLALTLSIGVSGGLGSYAWFYDTDIVENNQTVALGDLNTSVSIGFGDGATVEVELNEESTIEKTFDIKNEGSLNQRITNITFQDNGTNVSDKGKIIYELYDKTNNKVPMYNISTSQRIENCSLADLPSVYVKVDKVLDVKNTITYTSKLRVPANYTLTQDSKIKFNLVVNSEQINVNQTSGGSNNEIYK